MYDEEEVQAPGLVSLRSCDPLPLVLDCSERTHKQFDPHQTTIPANQEEGGLDQVICDTELCAIFQKVSYCCDTQTSGFTFKSGGTGGEDVCTITHTVICKVHNQNGY